MTVKSFWHNAYIQVSTARYVMIFPNGHERVIGRKQAAEMTFDPEMPLGWTIERRIVTNWVKACPWCGARPEQFEIDCDGPAGTGTCGSPQCNQLQRCEGCGEDGKAVIGSVRGRLCRDCNERARKENLIAPDDRYALIPWAEYYND